jgi:hypothetical protein
MFPSRTSANLGFATRHDLDLKPKRSHQHLDVPQWNVQLDGQEPLYRGQRQPAGLRDLIRIGSLAPSSVLDGGEDLRRFGLGDFHGFGGYLAIAPVQ